jgi:hypothetical protein
MKHMNREVPRPITPEEITSYQGDGVVLLAGLFDLVWIELLDKGLTTNCAVPTGPASD